MTPPLPPLPPHRSKQRSVVRLVLLGLLLLLVVPPLAGLATLYLEQNLSGPAEWRSAQQDLQAQGLNLDPAAWLPPTVPESTNLGALPLFRFHPMPHDPGMMDTTELVEVLDEIHFQFPGGDESSDTLPVLGPGGETDLNVIRARLVGYQKNLHPDVAVPTGSSSTQLLDSIFPFLSDLHRENVHRPDCVFEFPFDTKRKVRIAAGMVRLDGLARLLIYDATLALLEHNPERAEGDFALVLKFIRGTEREPSMTARLLTNQLEESAMELVRLLVDSHLASDTELAELDRQLGSVDNVQAGRAQLMGDLVSLVIPAYFRYRDNRSDLQFDLALQPQRFTFRDLGQRYAFIGQVAAAVLPDGWFDHTAAKTARRRFGHIRAVLDPEHHRVHPELEAPFLVQSDFDILLLQEWYEPGAERTATDALIPLAYDQARLDEARLAVRLERYRAAHRHYPGRLADLTQPYGPNPTDVMTGDEYRYRLTHSGYLLYSVGWNQVDDGGKSSSPRGVVSSGIYDEDWVW